MPKLPEHLEALVKPFKDYLAARFIWDEVTELPEDECEDEARSLLGLVAEKEG